MTTLYIKAVAPGQATLHIEPWSQDASGVELSIQRNEGAPHLDPDSRQWVGDEQWIQLHGAKVENSTLIMPVGPTFVDPLLAGTQGPRVRARVRVGNSAPIQCAVRIDPAVLPAAAAGDAPSVGGSSQISAPVQAVDSVSPPSSAEPAAASPAAQKPRANKNNKLLFLLAGALVLLAILAAALYFWLVKGDAKPNNLQEQSPIESVAAGCNTSNLANAEALSFVQDCVRNVDDSAALLAVIEIARDTGKCEIAQRLYANRANAGDVVIAQAYAREYDPDLYSKNACFNPDATTARYWYETVLQHAPDHADASTRLQALPQ